MYETIEIPNDRDIQRLVKELFDLSMATLKSSKAATALDILAQLPDKPKILVNFGYGFGIGLSVDLKNGKRWLI